MKTYRQEDLLNPEFSRRHPTRGHCSNEEQFERDEKDKIFKNKYKGREI